MASQKTITINGRLYDAVTGLPIDGAPAPKKSSSAPVSPKVTAKPAPVKPKAARPASTPRPDVVRITSKNAQATTVHGTVQRSQTLKSRVAKKPAPTHRPVTKRPVVGKRMDVAPNPSVSRFAKHPAPKQATVKASTHSKTDDAPVQMHPLAARAFGRTSPKQASPAKPATSKEVKDAAISKALATPSKKAKAHTSKAKKRTIRRVSIIVGAVILALGILFAIYKLVPSISVGIASSQAGINASYPEFTPDGYSLSQPVTYSDGQVDLKFNSNSNDNYYTITQTKSSWDSSAVLDNVVTPEAGADYVTTKERGLTIYTYDSIAVWVNGGILYKIDSKAPLSGDQIRRIATSL